MKNCSRILFISTEFPPGPGGIGTHAWNLSRGLNKYFPVDVITVSDYIRKKECQIFDNQEEMYIYRYKKYSFNIFTYMMRIYDTIIHLIGNKYSHCILSGKFSLYTSIIIRLIKREIKIIGILHGSELLPSKKINKLLLLYSLNKLNLSISVSNYTNQLIPLKSKLDKCSKFVVPNGVKVDIIDRKKSDYNLKLKGYPCLITVGSITDRKGQINLIKSLPEIITHFPKVHYHCVGLPIEKDNLLEYVQQLDLQKYITLHGFVPNSKLFEIYKQADILIMLSQNNSLFNVEGFGIVVLEANLFGIPAIGSKMTGIEDAILHNETGKLVDPYSPKEILDGIIDILNRKDKFSSMAIDWANQHNWNKITKKYLKIIENA